MSIKIRVRATSETVVGDAEVQHHENNDGPPHRVLCFHVVYCVEKVSELINRPVVSLFGTRVGGTSTWMIGKSI